MPKNKSEFLSSGFLVALALDLLDIFILDFIFTMPIIGDIIDLIGFMIMVNKFNITGWPAFLPALEIIPGLDFLPLFTASYVIDYYKKR